MLRSIWDAADTGGAWGGGVGLCNLRRPKSSSSSSHTMALVPPANYAVVEDGVVRCCMPVETNIAFIRSLGLKTVLLLSCEPFERRMEETFAGEKVKVKRLGWDHWVPEPQWKGVSESLVKVALETVLDKRTHPIALCCSTGTHTTGVVVACLRKLQMWGLSSVLEEYRVFADSHTRGSLMHFIDTFDTDTVSPPMAHIPDWYALHLSCLRSDYALQHAGLPAQPPYMRHYFSTCGPTVSVATASEPIGFSKEDVGDEEE